MDPIAKKILNTLKCPVCGGQIDVFDWAEKNTKRGVNFGCAYNREDFGIFFVHWEQPIRIEKEVAIVYEDKHQYEVIQEHYLFGGKVTNTLINIRDVDAENRVLDSSKTKKFTFNKLLFDFSKTNRAKLVNRIKTILVFQ